MHRLPGMGMPWSLFRGCCGNDGAPAIGAVSGSTFNVKVLLRSFSAWNLPLTTVTLPACLIRTFQCVGLGTPPKPPQ